MSAITKQILKRKMLDVCITKQQHLLDDFTQRIKTLAEPEGIGNEESYDNNVLAANQQKVAEINALNQQLEFAKLEMRLLETLRSTENLSRDSVTLGAVVITNRNAFFVCASLEQFVVDGAAYVGISTNSPIFQMMKRKTIGETFRYNDTNYKIKDIF